MSPAEFAVNFFVALFALIDPVGNVPFFAAGTAGVSARDRAQLAVYIALFVLGFLTFFYFTGLGLLAFFGISLSAFRIAGGVILFVLGLDMVRDDLSTKSAEVADAQPKSRREAVTQRFERMIVPFAMPLLIGPGAISTVIIYASQAKAFGLAGAAVGVAVIALVAVSTLLSFLATPLITRALGRIGLTIVVRVLGLILCAMAVQFILAGLSEATHGLIRSSGIAAPGRP
ncbi:MarC family protein [Phenylobacterium sp.]|uniref:MarC family protein n=1 Tax=Phenylobacterium sp. TaxID=1871053 RepID=UPI00260BB154|nr:MarC family protein [Phenylobacterium sp.]